MDVFNTIHIEEIATYHNILIKPPLASILHNSDVSHLGINDN